MAVLPDEIKDMNGKELKLKVDTTYEYIRYMREMIEFWGEKRQAEINGIQAIPSDTITSIIGS